MGKVKSMRKRVDGVEVDEEAKAWGGCVCG